jgi:hypothetical protein
LCRDCHRAERIVDPDRLIAAGKDLSRTFFGLQSSCAICHNDPHRGQMAAPRISRAGGARPGEGGGPAAGASADLVSCEKCHTPAGFHPAQFSIEDHEATAFPLDGAHLAVPCTDCHTEETDAQGTFLRFSPLPTSCEGCHLD